MKAQPTASHYVNGRYVEDDHGQPIDVIYPATGETIAHLHAATPNIVELAIEAARAAQADWARLKPVERGRVLRRASDILRERNADLARLETLDTDKAIQCADSWALFVTAFMYTWPDLDWDPRDAIETRGRSNAISGGKAPFAPPGRGLVIGGHRGKA